VKNNSTGISTTGNINRNTNWYHNDSITTITINVSLKVSIKLNKIEQ